MSKARKEPQVKDLKGIKAKDPKFRVIPNLSLKGADILRRLANRSLMLDGTGGQYSLDEFAHASGRMTKSDIILAHREATMNIQSLQNKLQNANKAK